jgi:hypothetical protein
MPNFHTLTFVPVLLLAAAAPAAAAPVDPLRFFEGRTDTQSTVRVVFKAPFVTRSIGQGQLERDGSLTLVQRVEDQGKPPHERRWRIREVSPGHFSGTLSEAEGPVTIDRVDDRYRFRFRMKGGLAVEQWVTPQADGTWAKTSMKVRKFGMTVATNDGTIRKLPTR